MKHIFIINPAAGKHDCAARIMSMAKGLSARHGLETDCILTKSPGHAYKTIHALAETGANLRIYACGGDGTVNETANAVAGYNNAAMTCVPVGTGNDFLKNFGDMAALFSDAENLWDGPQTALDAIDCNGRLALTVACFGFDAQVADDVHKYGKIPLFGGRGSYILSLAANFLRRGFGHYWAVTLDGERIEDDFILAAVCNGRYYGGGFVPAAEARMDDGVLNTVLVKRVSRFAFLRLVGAYAKGGYYQFPEIARGSKASEIIIESLEKDKDIVICLDGEIAYSKKAVIRLSEKKVNFFGPAGCSPNATAVPLPEKPEKRKKEKTRL